MKAVTSSMQRGRVVQTSSIQLPDWERPGKNQSTAPTGSEAAASEAAQKAEARAGVAAKQCSSSAAESWGPGTGPV